MKAKVRPARPDDAFSAVPLIYSSGSATFDYVLAESGPEQTTAFVSRAFQDDIGELGYSRHVVVEIEDEIVGVGAGFGEADLSGAMLRGIRHVLLLYGVVGGVRVVRRALQVERVVQPPRGDAHCIAHLGVAPAWRGKGIGSLLLEHLFQQGRARNRALAVLDVAVTNPRAQALYERHGFRVTAESVSTLRRGEYVVAGHRRMERSIAVNWA